MKKVCLSFLLAVLAFFSIVSCTYASTIYIDYMLGGNARYDFGSFGVHNLDLNQSLIGVEIPLKRFKIGLEYSELRVPGMVKKVGLNTLNINESKITDFQLKGGYAFIKNDNCEFYGNLSYFNRKDEAGSKNTTYSPVLAGFDYKYLINSKMFIFGNIDYAVCGKASIDKVGDMYTDYSVAGLKYTYLFTEKFGATVGYKWSELVGLNSKSTLSGFTIGLDYIF